MKKAYMLLIVLIILLAGCGKISSEVQDISSQDGSSTVYNETNTIEPQQYISGTSDLLKTYFINITETREANTTATEPSKLKALSFSKSYSASELSGPDGYEYWSYETGTNQIGNLLETVESKHRYYDRRTGEPFQKPANEFSPGDFYNIDFIEREQYYEAFYPENPNKKVYTLHFIEKITTNDNNFYNLDLWTNDAIMQYIGVEWDTLKITSRHVEYNHSTGVFDGNMEVQGTNNPDFHANFIVQTASNGKRYYQADILWNNDIMATVTITGESNNAETHYYLGKNFFYSSLAQMNGGIEDNSTIEFQDSEKYSETTTIDGSQNLAITGRLQNLTLKALENNQPEMKKKITIKNIDNLTVENINFKKGLRIIDCTNVIINGTNYGNITDQTIQI